MEDAAAWRSRRLPRPDAYPDGGTRLAVGLQSEHGDRPGADDSFVETLDAAEGRRIHFAHAQFYAYGATEGGGFRSAAERIAQAIADNPNATLDIGQVVFGQTVTVSLDILR